jgi:hypothetical protein
MFDYWVGKKKIHTINKITEALLTTSKDAGLEVNGEKTRYTVTSPKQTTGQITM